MIIQKNFKKLKKRILKRKDFTMRQKKSLVLMATGILLIMLLPALAFANVEDRAGVDKDALMKKVSGLQMPFIENQGQIKDKSVRFYANTFAGTVFVTDKGEIVYSLVKREAGTENTEQRQEESEDGIQNTEDRQINTKAVVLRESLECPEETGIKGLNKSVTTANYFVGSKDNWRTNIPTWQEVSLGEVYEGIELKLKAYGNNVEKLFTVYPGGTSEDITLKMEGAKGIKVNKSGELEIETELGTVKMTKPVAYQETGGEKKYIQVAYNVLADSGTYGFEIGEYDKTKPLVIDPLLASTFIGGSSSDYVYALALDSSGDVFVAGWTWSSDYPTTVGAYDTTHNGYSDVIVSKLDSNLSSLLASTFIGGGNYDHADAIAIDSSGDVFVAGKTWSSDYPTTVGAYDTTFNGNGDVFVSKLDSNLSSLLSSTFIGGSSVDHARALAIDLSGDVFVAGLTGSSDYPTTVGAYDTTLNGNDDVFVSKLDSSLSSLVSSTLIGGSGVDDAYALAIDSSGDVFVAGLTGSSDYPTTVGAFDTVYNSDDVFVSKLDSSLSSLVSSTLIGGSGVDDAYALAIDSSGDVFVAGRTLSSDYPTTVGAYDTTFNGNWDVFVSKLDSSLSSLLASTFIGGSSYDYVYALAIGSSGDLFAAGVTNSSDYPTTVGAYDTTLNGNGDVFVSKLDSSLSSLVSSTFIGGSDYEPAYAIAIDSSGDVFVAGQTRSSDYSTTVGAYDITFNGGEYDGIISKLDSDLSAGGDLAVPHISASPASKDFGSVDTGASASQIFTISNIGIKDLVINRAYLTGANLYQFSIENDTCSGMTIAPSGSCTLDAVFSPTKGGALSARIAIESNDPALPTLYLELTGTGIVVGEPDISASPASRDFGTLVIGRISPSQTFTISNIGTGYLVINTAYLTGTNPYQFSIQNDTCSGKTIAPSGSCIIEARYEPTKTGTMYAEIGIGSDDPDTPTLYIDLTGTGVNNTPPVADPNGPYTGIEGQTITLDGSGSTDSDGSIPLYEWDIDNDGTFDYISSSPTQSHTYAQQGTYTINLRVTDDLGATGEATTTATISDTSPTADFTGSPTSGLAPLTVNFTDNSTGYDQPLSNEWDFDNDGTIDSTVQNPSYTYNTAGTYTVSLTVTDSDGSANSLTRTDYITVTACLDPARISGATPVYYSALQAAYDAAVDGDTIQSQAVIFTEDLNINSSISVTFEGGYDCDYTAVTGETTINGTMTISDGTVTIWDFILE